MYVWCFCSNFNKLVRYLAVPQLKVVCRIFMYFPLSGRKGFPATRTPNPTLYIEYIIYIIIYIYIVTIHIKNRQCIRIQLYISWWLLSWTGSWKLFLSPKAKQFSWHRKAVTWNSRSLHSPKLESFPDDIPKNNEHFPILIRQRLCQFLFSCLCEVFMRKFYVQFDWQEHCVLCKVVRVGAERNFGRVWPWWSVRYRGLRTDWGRSHNMHNS